MVDINTVAECSSLNNLKCTLCNDIMYKAYKLPCCCIFCDKCVELSSLIAFIRANNCCISCGTFCEVSNILKSKTQKESVSKKKISCKVESCDWSGAVSDFDEHFKSHASISECPYKCGVKMTVYEVKMHIESCGFRIEPCELCERLFKFKDLKLHKEKCLSKVENCKVCEGFYLLKDKDDHGFEKCVKETEVEHLRKKLSKLKADVVFYNESFDDDIKSYKLEIRNKIWQGRHLKCREKGIWPRGPLYSAREIDEVLDGQKISFCNGSIVKLKLEKGFLEMFSNRTGTGYFWSKPYKVPGYGMVTFKIEMSRQGLKVKVDYSKGELLFLKKRWMICQVIFGKGLAAEQTLELKYESVEEGLLDRYIGLFDKISVKDFSESQGEIELNLHLSKK